MNQFTFDNAMVYPIDMIGFTQEVEEEVGYPVQPISNFGLVVNPTDITKAGILYQWDVVLMPFSPKVEMPMYKSVPEAVSILPSVMVKLEAHDLTPYQQEAVTIAEFVKDRRNYNRRIANNEVNITSWLNGK